MPLNIPSFVGESPITSGYPLPRDIPINEKGGDVKMTFKENNPGIFEFKEKEDSITGTLLDIHHDVGPSNSTLYTLKSEGKAINVWGSVILDQRMAGIDPGALIKITFKGLGEASAGKNAPKIFKVEEDDGLTEEEKVDDGLTEEEKQPISTEVV